MKKQKYKYFIWLLILPLLIQNSTVLAANVQELNNTAPVANFTVEKSREVKLLILSDYSGEDMAKLKNSITSMKSELANYAKINIEYASPADTTIGTQQGSYTRNYWAKNGYASYRKTGYSWSVNNYGQSNWQNFDGTPVTDKFVYSKEIVLPEGQTPNVPYGAPIKYTKSALKTDTANAAGNRNYYEYSFINNSGICDGRFSITTKYGYYFPNGAVQELDINFTEPSFTYEDFWSVQGSQYTAITNTVTGWDLSKLNYDIKDNTDTFVIFALDNEDTNYYSSHLAANYRLGQLRSDSNLGKYIKDSEARVYSICPDTLENVNLSTNPQYPIAFSGAAQNISLRDLLDSSFDGRSIGNKNIAGLVNKIKENVKRPSGKADMIVATDKDISSTDSFVNSIKDNISPDVDFKTNVVNMDSLEDMDAWKKYVTKGDYRYITCDGLGDTDIILTGNGALWARGSNALESGETSKYGLFGQSTTIPYYNNFIKIATNVKDAKVYSRSGNAIYIIKNDGTLWVCGRKGEKYNAKKDIYEPVYYTAFKQITEFSNVRSIAFNISGNGYMYVVTASGVYRCFIEWGNWSDFPPEKDPYAPASTQYVFSWGSDEYNLYYISIDGNVDYTHWKGGNQQSGLRHYSKFPAPVKAFTEKINGSQPTFICTDNKVYALSGQLLLGGLEVKQAILNISYGRYYILTVDGKINGTYSNIDKILFVEDSAGGQDGLIVRTLDGKTGYLGSVSYSNLLITDSPTSAKANNSTRTPVVFDASVNGTAADYIQLGQKLCYVTKQGEICYMKWTYTGMDSYGNAAWTVSTENYGRLEDIFDITDKPVKAFSKAKILETPIREGSERYLVYISDNKERDTYFNNPSDYFLFGNLDSTVLNYLNANRFNIYIVTPPEARDLKLQYPYVPANRQQYSLKELINNSAMDSAFCRDEAAVRKLITKKYDTFTKQGSTTLTLLVNEEGVRYNQIYSDFENDPKYSERWQYTHDPTYFDNSNGLDGNSGKWITEPLYTFSKVGSYVVTAQFRDNPKKDDRFGNYRLWSNISAPATIIVHRRPLALFNVQVSSKAGTAIYLTYLDKSYDPDHNVSRPDKGITARVWQYKKTTSDMWLDGKPYSLTRNTGIYQIRYSVKDIEGAWSSPYIDTIDTANIPPAIDATPAEYYGTGPVDIIVAASDNGENDFAYMRHAITNSTDFPTAAQWVRSDNGIKEKAITLETDGTYYLHLEAYDVSGQSGKKITGPYTISNVEAGNFYITMMLDVGWREYYFDMGRGADDNHDGVIDRYTRKPNTDIGTLKMPINYYSLVACQRTSIKSGYKVKGKICIQGNPDEAYFKINYPINRENRVDTVRLTNSTGDIYDFEWIIPLDTDNKSFVSFDLEMSKGGIIYGNEKWKDIWAVGNNSRRVFYIRGKATDDIMYVQSQ